MTSHLDSHGTTDIIPEILSGVQTRNLIQHDEYSICGIAHVRTHRKDNIVMRRRLLQSPTLNLKAFYGGWMGYILVPCTILIDSPDTLTIHVYTQHKQWAKHSLE